MQNSDENSATSRFYDFRTRPFDGINKRITYQFWPAFQSELKRKGLSSVLDDKYHPLPIEPTAALRKVAHDERVMTERLAVYDLALTTHLLTASGREPDIATLKIKPEDLAASESDRKSIKYFKDEMDRQATTANQALGIFVAFTSKSVQNDLAHILDEPVNHPRHKIFQLREFFIQQTPPNVAIGEKIKMEIGELPQARTYAEILNVANTIRDLQAELTLVNPTATLSLSEMVSKLLSKIQDKEFQMLRYQISEWEEQRLAALIPGPSPLVPSSAPVSASAPSSVSMSSSLSTSSATSSASTPSAGGGGNLRVSSLSLGVLVPPFRPRPPSVSVQFRPVIDLIQKFHLSVSSLDASASLNSVDVIINGGGAGSSQQSLTGNQSPMWGMPPDFRLPQYLQWMAQMHSPVKPSGGNAGTNRQSRFDDDYRGRRHPRNKTPNSVERRGDTSSRGDKSSRGDTSYRRRRDDVSNRDDSTSRGATSSRGERSDSRSTSSRHDSRNDSRESRHRDRDTSERSDRKRDRSVQASSLTVDLDEDDNDDDRSTSSDGSHSN